MSDAEAKRLLNAVRKARERAGELRVQAKKVQSDAVSAALDAGVSATEIAAALEVTRYRVYQIRDGL
ncbi:hypothetical protein [Mycobacteroides abscessus]|uniref:hypothetical protein n=1 Tax=Mycobacteroides abscessus TaxID=36809 RepID=UPI000C25BE31|nr:hypothetical protein [Mycobacteroides abscessus]MBN7567258.1 hypothetical protein [Mycobacteroides abscessus subsp. massiliense]